ncbi:hypothetical protein MFLAVUS_007987 [Mucor flavus]|uniref:Homeobox domain-containing protein n=1 Tax=Mucor flavus TaxID=439312 RepID=A0ABP9Z5U3_9FUNG
MAKEKSRRVFLSSEEISTAEDNDTLPSEDDVDYGTPVRPRQRFSTEETSILERAFKETPRPSAETKKDLAAQFETVPGRIQIWFQNRRAKEKKISGTNTPQPADNNLHAEDRREPPHAKKPRLENDLEPVVPLRPNIYYSNPHIPPGSDMYIYRTPYIFADPRNIDPGVGSSRGYVERIRHEETIVNREDENDGNDDHNKKGSF